MSREELVEKTNKAISELVVDNTKLQKAYNYYNCIRDKELFKYLEDNYGIGLPTEVAFIPLIKKHVDALIGEYLDIPIQPKVSCKDEETIHNIFREKLLKIAAECSKLLQLNLKNNLLRFISGKDMQDLNIQQQLDKLIEDINENFVSEYEIAGLNVVEYLIQSRNIDLMTKLRQLFLDLLVTGRTFYRDIPGKHNVEIKCYSPLDVFPEYNYDSPYIKDCPRIVVRSHMNRNQILNKYGKKLSKEDLNKIYELWETYEDVSNTRLVYGVEGDNGTPLSDGIMAGVEVSPYFNGHYYNNSTIPVYEVEWIETDKDFVMLRYSTTRIGQEIYILDGLDKDVIRTKDDPSKCTLSINGVYFVNRMKEPYSLVLAAMILLDKYDLSIFYRDKLIANSGSLGDWVNLPTIPTFLGDLMSERIMKWLAYKKQGIGLIDTSQEGLINTGQAPLNTMFNGFDDTLKVQAVQAIQAVIDSIELTMTSISGVFRERLNGILQRDAVTNVQVGIQNSFTVTKLWHFTMGLLLNEILTDALNCAKISWKDGLTGVLVLGKKLLKIFTALPKYFTNTDFDIHIITSTDIIKEMELIKMTVPEFIKSGVVPPDIIVEIMTAKSLTEMKVKIKKAIAKLKEENGQMLQLVLQNEQLQNQLQLLQQQLQQAQSKIESLNEAKLQIESLKIQLQYQVDSYKAKTDRDYKVNQAENDTKRTEIELLQLRDGNPYNDEVKNI